jgi:hypothetical protein
MYLGGRFARLSGFVTFIDHVWVSITAQVEVGVRVMTSLFVRRSGFITSPNHLLEDLVLCGSGNTILSYVYRNESSVNALV